MLLAAHGVITPLGVHSPSIYNAIEAGINRYQLYETALAGKTANIQIAKIPERALAQTILSNSVLLSPQDYKTHLFRLALAALEQLKAPPAMNLNQQAPMPLFLVAPEPYNDQDIALDKTFLAGIAGESDLPIRLENSRIFASGRAGIGSALAAAQEYFDTNGAHLALVGGVDSFLQLGIIESLNRHNRLLKADSAGGFAPAEGAGFLLLVSENAPSQLKHAADFRLQGLATDHAVQDSSPPDRAALATQLFSASFAQQDDKIATVYSSANGESAFIEELSLALMRHQSSFGARPVIVHPARSFGDLGAAMGPALVALAEQRSLTERTLTPTLVYLGSDSGLRCSFLMSTKLELPPVN